MQSEHYIHTPSHLISVTSLFLATEICNESNISIVSFDENENNRDLAKQWYLEFHVQEPDLIETSSWLLKLWEDKFI